MERKLASIQTILEINPIEGADNIVVATVLGWHCVVKKGEFNVGDKIIYIEVDSILPATPEFEFMAKYNYRVKTVRLRKQISQGLVVPISIPSWKNYRVGTDVTEALGIKKYDSEPDVEDNSPTIAKNKLDKFFLRFAWYRKFFHKKVSGKFPDYISKTDETRIQSIPKVVEFLNISNVSITEKLDGQSATFFLKKSGFRKYEFGVCSRNYRIAFPNGSNYWKIAEKYDIENVLRSMIEKNDLIVLQGEIVGEGIQGNKYKLRGLEFFAYNLVINGERINIFNRKYFDLLTALGIMCVPYLPLPFTLPTTVDGWVELSKGVSTVNVATLREGIVVRDYNEKISFKVISPEFLLKNGE